MAASTPTAFETGNDADIIQKQEPESVPPPEKKLKTDITSDDEDPYIKILSDDEGEDEPDSDDEFYDDGLHTMTKREADRYYKQIQETEGFDVDPLPNVFGFGLIVQANLNNFYEDYEYITELAIKHYNKNKNNEDSKITKLSSIVKANVQAACPLNYYITFEALDSNGLTKIYQAKVYRSVIMAESEVDFVRLKPGSN